jgi:glycosyltransferase involved in cell wall biosynthesis
MSSAEKVRVLGVSAQGLTSPGFRARILLLRPELARHRVSVEPLPLFTPAEAETFGSGALVQRATTLLRARRRLVRQLSDASPAAYDVALIQRQADLLPSLDVERRVSAGRRLVWDVDDAIWLDTSLDAGGHHLATLKRTARKVRWLASSADCVVAANTHLADSLSRYSSRVVVVPSVVETRGIEPRRHEDGGELVLGWIGSPTTSRYLARLADVIWRVARELQDRVLRLLVIGGAIPPHDGYVVESRRWSLDREFEALRQIDVGLMPMPDNPWTRGKSAYKALQYMSAGIPVVADNVGIASQVLDAGQAGYAVRGDDEWVEALIALARDAELRARLGSHGRRRVEENFSVQCWAPVMAEILRGKESRNARPLVPAPASRALT